MTDLRKAAERLLEALDDGWVQRDDWVAITLRQALAQSQHPLDIYERAYFAGKQDGIDETEAINKIPTTLCGPNLEQTLNAAGFYRQREQWDTSDMAHRSGGLSVEQEPVACVCKEPTSLGIVHRQNAPCFYYIKPPKREWVGLTDEEIDYIWGISPPDYEKFFDFPRAIEAKLKEKNT
jgi:hypothetical protein